MKKMIFAAIAVMTFGFVSAQDNGFKVGAHVGLPVGDSKDLFSVNLGVDVAYLWKVTDKFSAGATTGYSAYLGKSKMYTFGPLSYELTQKDVSYIPVAATAQYSIVDNFFVGIDLGYAISVTDEADGGFLYQPKAGYQNKKIEVYMGYKGISDHVDVSSINLGFNYKF
ncbi:porin family protein [Flavobacterium sp. N1736]|uniref:porin family protein n=1 Tax=Flavobacterium sp. N1736 TaxID=2986823 RepID=UPI0022244E8D|nr:porin family protein [Flavobacterium sp. N1736]